MSRRREPPDAADLERLAPDAYAGQWLDEHGRLHVAYCDDPERHARDAQEKLGLSRKVVVVHHRRGLRELRLICDAVDEPEWWLGFGSYLSMFGVNEPDNVVEVGVDPLTDAARAAAAERFGEAVRMRRMRIEAC